MKVRRMTQAEREEFRDDVRADGWFPDATVEHCPLFIAEGEGGKVGYGMTREEAAANLDAQREPDVEIETESTWDAFDANLRRLLRPV